MEDERLSEIQGGGREEREIPILPETKLIPPKLALLDLFSSQIADSVSDQERKRIVDYFSNLGVYYLKGEQRILSIDDKTGGFLLALPEGQGFGGVNSLVLFFPYRRRIGVLGLRKGIQALTSWGEAKENIAGKDHTIVIGRGKNAHLHVPSENIQVRQEHVKVNQQGADRIEFIIRELSSGEENFQKGFKEERKIIIGRDNPKLEGVVLIPLSTEEVKEAKNIFRDRGRVIEALEQAKALNLLRKAVKREISLENFPIAYNQPSEVEWNNNRLIWGEGYGGIFECF